MKSDTVLYVLLGILILALVIAGPLLSIWALNTLFNLGIAYNFYTWLAALLLGAAVKSNVKVSK